MFSFVFLFCIFFWWARESRPLLRLCRPFMIFERCLYSNPECCRSKLARYRLSHPSLYVSYPSLYKATHPSINLNVYTKRLKQDLLVFWRKKMLASNLIKVHKSSKNSAPNSKNWAPIFCTLTFIVNKLKLSGNVKKRCECIKLMMLFSVHVLKPV